MEQEKANKKETENVCRYCEVELIKRFSKEKPRKNRKYYFEYYFYCSKCKRNYMVESAKRFWEENPNLDRVSP